MPEVDVKPPVANIHVNIMNSDVDIDVTVTVPVGDGARGAEDAAFAAGNLYTRLTTGGSAL